MGVLQDLQIEMSLGIMRPSLNGVGFRGDLMGDDSAGSRRPAGRLFARWVRPETDLLRSFGAIVVGGFGCDHRVRGDSWLASWWILVSNNESFPALTISGGQLYYATKKCM